MEILRAYDLKPGDTVVVIPEESGIRIVPKRHKLTEIKPIEMGKRKWDEIEAELDESCCI